MGSNMVEAAAAGANLSSIPETFVVSQSPPIEAEVTAEEIAVLRGHDDSVYSAAFTGERSRSNGLHSALARLPPTVRCWPLLTASCKALARLARRGGAPWKQSECRRSPCILFATHTPRC